MQTQIPQLELSFCCTTETSTLNRMSDLVNLCKNGMNLSCTSCSKRSLSLFSMESYSVSCKVSLRNKQDEMNVPQNGKQGNASKAIRTISFCYQQHVLRTYVQQRTGQNSTNKKAISITVAKVLFCNFAYGNDSANVRANGICSQPTFSGYFPTRREISACSVGSGF